jgi:hypothetical protein
MPLAELTPDQRFKQIAALLAKGRHSLQTASPRRI